MAKRKFTPEEQQARAEAQEEQRQSIAWDKISSVGDYSTMCVPEALRHFKPPPGEYTVMVSCICETMVDWVVVDHPEYTGFHIAYHRPGRVGPPPKHCPRRRWHKCTAPRGAKYKHKLQKGAPIHRILKPAYEEGTRALDWGGGPKKVSDAS